MSRSLVGPFTDQDTETSPRNNDEASLAFSTFLRLRSDVKKLEQGAILYHWTSDGLSPKMFAVDLQSHSLCCYNIEESRPGEESDSSLDARESRSRSRIILEFELPLDRVIRVVPLSDLGLAMRDVSESDDSEGQNVIMEIEKRTFSIVSEDRSHITLVAPEPEEYHQWFLGLTFLSSIEPLVSLNISEEIDNLMRGSGRDLRGIGRRETSEGSTTQMSTRVLMSEGDAATESAIDEPSDEGEEEEEIDDDGADTIDSRPSLGGNSMWSTQVQVDSEFDRELDDEERMRRFHRGGSQYDEDYENEEEEEEEDEDYRNEDYDDDDRRKMYPEEDRDTTDADEEELSTQDQLELDRYMLEKAAESLEAAAVRQAEQNSIIETLSAENRILRDIRVQKDHIIAKLLEQVDILKDALSAQQNMWDEQQRAQLEIREEQERLRQATLELQLASEQKSQSNASRSPKRSEQLESSPATQSRDRINERKSSPSMRSPMQRQFSEDEQLSSPNPVNELRTIVAEKDALIDQLVDLLVSYDVPITPSKRGLVNRSRS